MVVGAISSRTELAVIGAGPGGYVAALRAADAGLDVTLIERELLGGTCLNVGCIPSKALIEIASTRHAAMTGSAVGLTAAVDVDFAKVTRHLAKVSGKLRQGVASLLKDAGVTVIEGNANFARYDRLSIEQGDRVSHLEFDNAIVATGSRAIELANFAMGDRILDSTDALALTQLPASLAIVGGGYIGIELGTAYAKLGAAVTIIEAADTILATMPAELRRPVEQHLSAMGVELIVGDTAEHPTNQGLTLSSGIEIGAEVIVVTAGRRPNSDRCALDAVNVDVDERGHVRVDHQMRAAPGIYAIGDLVPGPALAHKATAEAEVAVDAILRRPASFDALVPAVVFSDPELMTVGVTPSQAQNTNLRVHRFTHAASARAQTTGMTTGVTIVVVDEHDTIVGVHIAGPHASELAGEATLAIEMAATLEDLSLAIHPHPTMSESLVEAAWLARGAPLHIRR